MLFMAWSPVRRTNAGRFEVDHPGDYATFNSYHPTDATLGANEQLKVLTGRLQKLAVRAKAGDVAKELRPTRAQRPRLRR
jgi:hypothetical protein